MYISKENDDISGLLNSHNKILHHSLKRVQIVQIYDQTYRMRVVSSNIAREVSSCNVG